MQIGDLVEITCDRLSYGGGRGVGRIDGAVVFISGAAPNEKVRVRIDRAHKSYFEASTIEILEVSKTRRDPLCPVFATCGGCVWQHVQYSTQILEKENFIKHFLRKYLPQDYKVKIYPAAEEYYYRNRIQLHVRDSKIGYFARGTNDLVPIVECAIAAKPINQQISGFLRSNPKDGKYEFAEESDLSVSIRPVPKSGLEFRQINSAQNLILQNLVGEIVQHVNASKIVELYAGSGNLSFALARKFKNIEICAVEFHPESVRIGERNAHLENLEQLHFVKADARKYLQKGSFGSSDLLLVDPPRIGLGKELISMVLESNFPHIIYVSCNLATLDRDLGLLSPKYKLVSAVGIDMFPQTDYVEGLVHLALRPTD